MEVRQLRSFVVLAEELHFGRAAVRLNLAQPALSQHMKQLEAYLGTTLFDRTSRSVVLSQSGRTFLPRARSALQTLQVGEEELKAVGSGSAGTVHVTFVSTAAVQLIPDLLQRVKRRYPGIRLRLTEAAAASQVEGLLAGEFDIGFMHASGLHPGLETFPAEISTVLLALASRHPLAKAPRISLKEIENETFLLPARTPHKDFYDVALALCEKSGFIPKSSQEVTFLQTALPLIAAGAGCALLPDVFKRLRPRHVVFRKLEGPQLRLPLYATTKRDGLCQLARNVIELVSHLSDGLQGARDRVSI